MCVDIILARVTIETWSTQHVNDIHANLVEILEILIDVDFSKNNHLKNNNTNRWSHGSWLEVTPFVIAINSVHFTQLGTWGLAPRVSTVAQYASEHSL